MVGTFVDEQEYSLNRINFKALIEKRIIVSLGKINHEICINR